MRARRATTRTAICPNTPTEATRAGNAPALSCSHLKPPTSGCKLATRLPHHWSQRAASQMPWLVPKVKAPANRLTVLFASPVARDGTVIPAAMMYSEVPSGVRLQAGDTVSVLAVLEDTVRT